MNAKLSIPQHSSETWDHPTPTEVIRAAKLVLGTIDLDPASSLAFNERGIGAAKFFSEADNGLEQEWSGTVFLNPPGGAFTLKTDEIKRLTYRKHRATKRRILKARRAVYSAEAKRWGTKSRAAAWWRKLAEEFTSGRVKEAIFIGFTLEILRSAQDEQGRWAPPSSFSLCFPRERLEFAGSDPTHANVIIYLGANKASFREHFSQFGEVKE